MRLHLFCIGRRPPAWARDASDEYLKRLGSGLDLRQREFAPRVASTSEQQRERESAMLLEAVPAGATLVALDERGEQWSTVEFAARLGRWRDEGAEVVFALGGAEGHAPALRHAARAVWALSRLTLPHALARVVVVEQIYRARSLLDNHPYHRA